MKCLGHILRVMFAYSVIFSLVISCNAYVLLTFLDVSSCMLNIVFYIIDHVTL